VFIPERPHIRITGSHKNNRPRTNLVSYVTAQSVPILSKPMSFSSASELAARWVSLIGTQPIITNPLRISGTWIADIPSRVGSDTAIDLAMTHVLDSNRTYMLKSDETTGVARSSVIRALKNLRLAWQKNNGQNFDLLLAVKLHFTSEECFTYIPIHESPGTNIEFRYFWQRAPISTYCTPWNCPSY
jgi:hypothetical protein